MNPVMNTYLAAPKAAITHFDSSQSDSLPFPVPSGESTVHASLPLTPALPQAVNGPINIMTLASLTRLYVGSYGPALPISVPAVMPLHP